MCSKTGGQRAEARLHLGDEARDAHRRILLAKLMVATHEHDALRVEAFERKEKRHHLQLVGAAVDKVAVEDVRDALNVARRAVRGEAVQLEELEQVAQLAVHVAKHLDRRCDAPGPA